MQKTSALLSFLGKLSPLLKTPCMSAPFQLFLDGKLECNFPPFFLAERVVNSACWDICPGLAAGVVLDLLPSPLLPGDMRSAAGSLALG